MLNSMTANNIPVLLAIHHCPSIGAMQTEILSQKAVRTSEPRKRDLSERVHKESSLYLDTDHAHTMMDFMEHS